MSKRYQAAIITATYNGLLVPNAPTIGTATAGAGSASVTFTAPSNVGGGAITSYTAISSPGGITGTAASSPVTVSGLTNGTAYTFTVVATNAYGSGPTSAASNSVTPSLNYIEDVFSTWLYTGTGATQTITNGIDLAGKGGLVWSKRRSTAESHVLLDTARNNGSSALYSDATSGQQTAGNFIQSFNSNGYSIGSNSLFNASGSTNVSWTFRKQPKFFDVVTYTGAGSVDYAHALGSVPGFALYKATNGTSNWNCVCRKSDGTYELLQLNTTASTFATYANAAAAGLTSTTFNPSPAGSATPSTQFVAYLFAHNAGGFGLSGTDNVISCGSYTGNGSSTGPVVDLGYEPQWVMVKQSSASGQWWNMIDVMRGFDVSTGAQTLGANASDVEYTNAGFGSGTPIMSPTATGFQVRSAQSATNASGATYIYIAIRRGPMKVPTDGTNVFSPVAWTGTGASASVSSGFPSDSAWLKQRNASSTWWQQYDRLRGNDIVLASNSTNAESTNGGGGAYFTNSQNAITLNGADSANNGSGGTYADYFFRRAPGFFDEVCWTGNNGANQRVSHNLGVAPELIIYKGRNKVNYWRVYFGDINKYIQLDAGIAAVSGSNFWGSSAPTTTDFGINCGSMDLDSFNAVGYLFATCPGVSKVGSYTGTGALQTINCGFTAGARFVLIKRTDSTGDWYTYDSARGITSGNDPYLLMNSTAAEVTGTNYVDTDVTGFKVTAAAPAGLNASGGTYIFLAIA